MIITSKCNVTGKKVRFKVKAIRTRDNEYNVKEMLVTNSAGCIIKQKSNETVFIPHTAQECSLIELVGDDE